MSMMHRVTGEDLFRGLSWLKYFSDSFHDLSPVVVETFRHVTDRRHRTTVVSLFRLKLYPKD